VSDASDGLGVKPPDVVGFAPPDGEDTVYKTLLPDVPEPEQSPTDVPASPKPKPRRPRAHKASPAASADAQSEARPTKNKKMPGWMLVFWAVAIALLVAAIAHYRAVGPSTPMVAPGTGWQGPFAAGVNDPVVMPLTLGDVILLRQGFTGPITAFDLDSHTNTLSVTPDTDVSPIGDQSDFVTIAAGQIEVYDPKTGQLVGHGPAPSSWVNLLWVGDGKLLIEDWKSQTICASLVETPDKCLWQAADADIPASYVFGGGLWVNTGDGVIDMETGQPTPFGQDAGRTVNDTTYTNTTDFVYYAGDSVTRIFRVVVRYDFNTNPRKSVTYQPWDLMTNTGISPPVTATQVFADASSSAYIAVTANPNANYGAAASSTSAYDWQTGKLLWTVPSGTYRPALHLGAFVGGSFIMPVLDSRGFDSVVAADPVTGNLTWQPDLYYEYYVGNIGNTVFSTGSLLPRGKLRAAGQNDQLLADDAGNGFTRLWRSQTPEVQASCQPQLAGHLVFCVDTAEAAIYVLDL